MPRACHSTLCALACAHAVAVHRTPPLRPTRSDAALARWLAAAGVAHPKAAVFTTRRSIADRGLFARASFAEGETIALIPPALALCHETGARAFPELEARARALAAAPVAELALAPEETPWRATLTAHCIAATASSSARPWAAVDSCPPIKAYKEWIASWRRDDAVTTLFATGIGRGARPLPRGTRLDDRLEAAAEALAGPSAAASSSGLTAAKLGHMLEYRYENFREHCETLLAPLERDGALDCRAVDVGRQYITCASRAVYLPRSSTIGVVPLHDMINHADRGCENAICDVGVRGEIAVVATRAIEPDAEVLLCYIDVTDADDADADAHDNNARGWARVNWGLP